MTPERSKAWMAILGVFSKVWPFFVPDPALAEAWEFALADLADDELASAARQVMATQSHQPTPADLRDAAHGKLQRVDVWKRDAFGGVVLVQGAPVSVARRQMRVKPGQPAPVLLSWGTPDDKYAHGIEPGKLTPLLPASNSLAASLVDGIARKCKPS